MLDSQIKKQLQSVYQQLESDFELLYDDSEHEKQTELIEMIKEVASTSDRIRVKQSGQKSSVPQFSLSINGKKNGISFKGIPGGHEFTSLVLAILNSDGKGKLPDKGFENRVKRLKGPIQLKTYISLSCENCPEVVQALNIMATMHDQFSHEMIDGAFVQEEISALGIQGVPSVMHADQLVSSGKVSMSDLLTKLEKVFGSTEQTQESSDLGTYDVLVIGGGPAGASSAIYTARKGLKTAIIAERLGGQVRDTKGIENLISVRYTEGPELTAKLADHIDQYPIDTFEHRRVQSVKNGKINQLMLDSGETIKARSLIVATGAKWRELGIPGEKEYIGRGVAFCPHCDGPYYKGKDVAVIGGGNSGVEAAIDLAGIVKSVVLIEFLPELKADKVLIDKLESLSNVSIIKNARTSQVFGNGEKVTALEFEDRDDKTLKNIDLDGVFVQIGLMPNSQFISDLVETNRFGEIEIDNKCRTNIPGIYAAGDVTTVPFKQIIISMGEGAKAGLTAFEEQMMA